MLWHAWRKLTRKRDPVRPAPSYHAVTVAPVARCCEAARATLLQPILVRNLPRLPLPGCTMPQSCRCELREWADRRIGERRLPEAVPHANSERRARRGRRVSDRKPP